MHLWPYLGSLLQAPDFHPQKHFSPVTVPAAKSASLRADAVKCSLLLQPLLDTMVNSTVNWSRQLHVHSVSVVYHLTCHQEPNGVSAWDLSLLSWTGLNTKFSPMLSQTLRLFNSWKIHQVLSCFPWASFLAYGLGLQQAGPKIHRQTCLLIFCIQEKPTERGPSQSCPAAFSFTPGNGDQAPAISSKCLQTHYHPKAFAVLTTILCGEQLGGKKR